LNGKSQQLGPSSEMWLSFGTGHGSLPKDTQDVFCGQCLIPETFSLQSWFGSGSPGFFGIQVHRFGLKGVGYRSGRCAASFWKADCTDWMVHGTGQRDRMPGL